MECVYKPEINCCDINGKCYDSKCPDTHTCCWQSPNDDKPTLGLCVLKDIDGGKKNCDFKRGIPKKDCNMSSFQTLKTKFQNIKAFDFKEGYNTGCEIYGHVYLFLLFIFTLFLIKMVYRSGI